MPFGWVTWVDQRNHALDGGPDPQEEMAILGFDRSIEKHCQSMLRCMQQIINTMMSSK